MLTAERRDYFEHYASCKRPVVLQPGVLRELLDALDASEAREKRLREALAEISRMGRVCPEFETCDHPACHDSCQSNLIAKAALAAP